MKHGVLMGLINLTACLCTAQVPVDKKESTNFMFYFLKGEELFDARKYEQALVNYNESLILYPYYPETYYSRAVTKEKLKDQNGALQDYNIYLELKPDRFDALFSRALLLYGQEKWLLANNDFRKLLTLPRGETSSIYYRQDPFTGNINQMFTSHGSNNAYLYNYVGLANLELKDFDKALIYFDSAILLNPNDADYFVNAGRCYESLGKVNDARMAYETAIDINPNHGLAKHNLGIINRNSGGSAEADKILEEVIAKNPNLPFAYAERALSESGRGNYRRALEDYNEAIRLAPDEPEYLIGRGAVKERLNDWSGAFDDFTRAITLDETFEKAWLNRANLLYKKGQFAEAIKDYDIALLLAADYEIAFYNRALAKHKIGDSAGACQDLKKARSLGYGVNEKVMSKICGMQ